MEKKDWEVVPPELECPWSKVDKMVVRRQVKYGSDRPKVHHRVYVIGWLLALIHHGLRNRGLRIRPGHLALDSTASGSLAQTGPPLMY